MTAADPTCLFCKIVAGADSRRSRLRGRRDPRVQGHSPAGAVSLSRHSEGARRDTQRLHGASRASSSGGLLLTAQALAAEHGLPGYRVAMNVNREGGQVVFHAHLHVLGGRPLKGALGDSPSRFGSRVSRKDNLIWIDLEMTGLEPGSNRIIEIATVVTDKELTVLAEGPVFAIHQTDEVLGRDGRMEHAPARELGSHRARAREPGIGAGSGTAHARVPAAARRSRRIADLRQQHLPGSTFLDSPHAGARRVLSLPQSRRLDAEDPREALVAGGRQSGSRRNPCTWPLPTSTIRSASCGFTASTCSSADARAVACSRKFRARAVSNAPGNGLGSG